MCLAIAPHPTPPHPTPTLQRMRQNAETTFGHDVHHFVEHNYYMHDDIVEQAVSLMTRHREH
jgi:hypothetical protein